MVSRQRIFIVSERWQSQVRNGGIRGDGWRFSGSIRPCHGLCSFPVASETTRVFGDVFLEHLLADTRTPSKSGLCTGHRTCKFMQEDSR